MTSPKYELLLVLFSKVHLINIKDSDYINFSKEVFSWGLLVKWICKILITYQASPVYRGHQGFEFNRIWCYHCHSTRYQFSSTWYLEKAPDLIFIPGWICWKRCFYGFVWWSTCQKNHILWNWKIWKWLGWCQVMKFRNTFIKKNSNLTPTQLYCPTGSYMLTY